METTQIVKQVKQPNKVGSLIGKKFGRLLVISLEGINKHGNTVWKCLCDCGVERLACRTALVSGKTSSCGCYFMDVTKLPIGEASLHDFYTDYRNRAIRKGLRFDLDLEKFMTIIGLNCFYCGCSPYKEHKSFHGNGSIISNGIDRLDSSVGYTEENCVPCCPRCNYAKRNMSYRDFKSWIYDLSDHMLSKNVLHSGLQMGA